MKKLIVILAILICTFQVAWAQDEAKDKNASNSGAQTEQAKPAEEAQPSEAEQPAEEQTGPVNNWGDFQEIIKGFKEMSFHTTFGAEYQSKSGNFLYFKRYRVPENSFFLRDFDVWHLSESGNRIDLKTHDITEPDWQASLKVTLFPFSLSGDGRHGEYEIYGYNGLNRILDRTKRYQGNYSIRGVSQSLKGLELSYSETRVTRTAVTANLNRWTSNELAASYNFGLGENLDVRARLSHHALSADDIGIDDAKTNSFALDVSTKGPHFNRVALFGGLVYSNASADAQESDQTYWDVNGGLKAYHLLNAPLNFKAYARLYNKSKTPTLNTRQDKYNEYGASFDFRNNVVGYWTAGYIHKNMTVDRLLFNDPAFIPIKYTALSRALVDPFTVVDKPKVDSWYITATKQFCDKLSLFHQTDIRRVSRDPISDVVAVGSDPLFPDKYWRSKTRLAFTPDPKTRFFIEDLYTTSKNVFRDQKLVTNVVTGSAFRQFNQKTSAMFSVARYDYKPLIDANLVKYDTDSWVYDFTVNHTIQKIFTLDLGFSHTSANGVEQYTQDGFNCNVRLLGRWPFFVGFEYGRRSGDYFFTQDNRFFGVNVGLDFTY